VYTKEYITNLEADIKIAFISIEFPRKLPHIIINSKKQSAVDNSTFTKSQNLQTEGDFNKYFDLYVTDNNEVTALSFLTPDVMAFLIDNMSMCDIEIIENKMYIYWNKYYSALSVSANDYKKRFTLAAKLLDQIGRKLRDGDIFTESSPTNKTVKIEHITEQEIAKLKKNFRKRPIFKYIMYTLLYVVVLACILVVIIFSPR